MKNNILQQAQKIVTLRRYEAENEAINNKIKAMDNNVFKATYEAYTSKIIENAKNGIGVTEETEQLKTKVNETLIKLGLPPIEPQFTCKICNDTGVVNNEYCVCLKREINKILIEKSGFDSLEDFKDAKFDIFENKEFMQKLYKKMQEWCHSNFNKTTILLSGQTGVGKTHLMKCMAKELIDINKVVTVTTSFAMNQDFMKSHFTRDLEEKDSLLDKYLSAEILFIDDLGTELRQPGLTIQYLYLILNERKMHKRPTVITTNLNLNEINEYYDERVASRIADQKNSICVWIDGKDLRLKK